MNPCTRCNGVRVPDMPRHERDYLDHEGQMVCPACGDWVEVGVVDDMVMGVCACGQVVSKGDRKRGAGDRIRDAPEGWEDEDGWHGGKMA